METYRFYELIADTDKDFEKLCKACKINENHTIRSEIQRLNALCKKQESEMKNKLANLLDKVGRWKESIENKKKESSDIAQVEEGTKTDLMAAKQRLDAMKQRQADTNLLLEEKKALNKKLLEHCNELRRKDEQSQKYKSLFALYTDITKLKWLYDCDPDEVKGMMKNGKEFKSFSLNKKDCSQFFIVNYLWDQMSLDM